MPETMRREKQGVIICLIQQSLSWMAIPIAFIRVSGKRRDAGSGPACVMISVVHCHRARNYCQRVNIPCHPRFYSIASQSLESCSLLLRSAQNTVAKKLWQRVPSLGLPPAIQSTLSSYQTKSQGSSKPTARGRAEQPEAWGGEVSQQAVRLGSPASWFVCLDCSVMQSDSGKRVQGFHYTPSHHLHFLPRPTEEQHTCSSDKHQQVWEHPTPTAVSLGTT